ncbi:MAG: hypothetical protein HY876_02590 [Coriobacteriales bacterium]|nr:hypothetical protein [Coriobacteriales bacterium]
MNTSATRLMLAAIALVLVGTTLTLAGCSSGRQTPAQQPPQATPATEPDAPELGTPEDAMRSYLAWSSYAYRLLESDVSSPTASPEHQVRVDSYVELNRQKGQAIEQQLTNLDIKDSDKKGSTATIVAVETWRYRYIDTSTGAYKSPEYTVVYDTTYTLKRDAKRKVWVVDNVKAQPRGEVK